MSANVSAKTGKLAQCLFLITNKDFKGKSDSIDLVKQDITLNEFAVLQLHVMKLCPYNQETVIGGQGYFGTYFNGTYFVNFEAIGS